MVIDDDGDHPKLIGPGDGCVIRSPAITNHRQLASRGGESFRVVDGKTISTVALGDARVYVNA